MSLRRLSVTGLALLLASCSPSHSDRDAEPKVQGPTAATTRAVTSQRPSSATNPAAARPQPGTAAGAIRTTTPPAPSHQPNSSEKAGATDPPGPVVLFEQAERVALSGQIEKAKILVERALKIDPTFRKALLLQGFLTWQLASERDRPESSPLYLLSARAMRRLRETYKNLDPRERELLSVSLYNEACTYAFEKREKKALDALADALDAGFSQADKLAEDGELNSIRRSPRFQSLVEQVERQARALAVEKAGKLAAGTAPFPFDFALTDPDGKPVTLGDVKGDVTIVTFWGTWCAPCRRAVPLYRELIAKYRDQGLSIVALDYERDADEDARRVLRAFVKKHEIPYPCLIGDAHTREQVPDFAGYPTTLFLDRTGKVRVRLAGECSFLELEAIVSLLLQPSEGPSLERKASRGGASRIQPPNRIRVAKSN